MVVLEPVPVDGSVQNDLEWKELPWDLASEEAERIGIEHIAQISTSSSTSKSFLNKQLYGQLGAINMLLSRLQIIDNYLTVYFHIFKHKT